MSVDPLAPPTPGKLAPGAGHTRAAVARALRPLLAYGLLPNLAFWLLGTRLYLMRPLFDVDYLLLGALSPWLGRPATLLGLALALGGDAVVNVAPAFHFQLADLLSALRHLTLLEPGPALAGAAALALLCAAGAAAVRAAAGEGRAPAALLLAAALLAGADIANGTSFVRVESGRSFADFNLANSAAYKTARALAGAPRGGPAEVVPLPAGASAAGPLLALARDPGAPLPPLQRALVVVESLGLARDPALAQRILAPLARLEGRGYTVRQGTVPFHGVTMDGEYRELCGVRLGARGTPPADCLPAALARRGYQTVSLHGFTSQFYDRQGWYPQLGFDRTLFAEDLAAQGLDRRCGSGFRGLCDADVAGRLQAELRAGTAEHPRFVYWLTLNSHLPQDAATGEGSSLDCQASPATRESEAVCRHARALEAAVAAVARVASSPELPPTEFVVVGDHAPPFLSREQRAAFDDQQVPYLVLSPGGDRG